MSVHPVTTGTDIPLWQQIRQKAQGSTDCAFWMAVADEVKRLTLSATARDWQPIATAPHMRKIIVHYLNQLGKHRTVMACYYEKNSLEMHDDYAEVGTYDAEKDGYFADEGWYEEHDSEDPIMKLQGEPDHWMPLPSPPNTGEKP